MVPELVLADAAEYHAATLESRATTMEEAFYLVEHVTRVIAAEESAGSDRVALGPYLRAPAADALEATAAILRPGADDPGDFLEADRLLGELVHAVRDRRQVTDDDLFTAGAIVIVIRRLIIALAPDDVREELPQRH